MKLTTLLVMVACVSTVAENAALRGTDYIENVAVERELKKSSSSRSKKKRRRRRRRSSSSSSSDDNNRDLWRMFYHLNNFDDRRNDYDCDNVDYWGRCIDRRNNDWGDDWNRFFRRSHRSGTRRRGRNSSSSSKSNK